MKSTIISTKNIQYTFNENLSLENIFYNNKKFIDKIEILDHDYNELQSLKTNFPYIDNFSNILKKVNFNYKYESKRKSTFIFVNGKHQFNKNELNINFIIETGENYIKIHSKNNCTKKTIYGITISIKFSNETKLIPPYFLENNIGIISTNYDDVIEIKNANNILNIMSTFSRNVIGKDSLVTSPLIHDEFRKISKLWIIKNNNKNFNVFSMNFK